MTTPVRAGVLDKEVSVQSRSTQKDTFGQQVIAWSLIKVVYAHIEPLTGSEREAAMTIATDISHRVTVYFDDFLAVDPKQITTYRLVYNNGYVDRIFNINAPMNIDEANVYVELLCNEGMTYGG